MEESYSYENKANYKSNIKYSLIKDPIEHKVYSLALDAWRALECRDGGRIDIRCDASGRPNFIEVNPLAGLNPDDSDLPITPSALPEVAVEYPAMPIPPDDE